MTTTLVIEREKWLRGTGEGVLLNDAGLMCCLGFEGIACGAKPGLLLDAGRPDCTAHVEWPGWLVHYSDEVRATKDCEGLMRINDDKEIDDSERERLIAAIFAKHGVTVRFV